LVTLGDKAETSREGAMAGKKRRISDHEAGETTPCAECREELRLLQRAQELKDEHGLEGRALLEGVLDSLHQEQELESMWRRRPKTR
jgi:hypothetical protein